MTEPPNYANVACVRCGTPYWYGLMVNPDIDDWGATVPSDVCPKCGSDQRRPWPRISVRPVIHDAEGRIIE